jgi:hypothetical protein
MSKKKKNPLEFDVNYGPGFNITLVIERRLYEEYITEAIEDGYVEEDASDEDKMHAAIEKWNDNEFENEEYETGYGYTIRFFPLTPTSVSEL